MNYQPILNTSGFYSCSPKPSVEELQKYYEEEFFQAEKPGLINDSSKKIRDTDSDFYNLQYQIFSHMLNTANSSIHVDLGCGYGHFLEYISQNNPNIKLRGCEVYPESSHFVNQIPRATFRQIDLNYFSNLDSCLENATSSSLINTLEHLQNPLDFLRECKKFLPSGSRLLVQVPNDFNPIQETAVKQLDLDQWWFCPPRHISYFTPSSLKQVIMESGLIVEDLITTFPIDMFLIAGINYRKNPSDGRKAHSMRTLFEDNYAKTHGIEGLIALYRHFAEAGIGREIVAIIKAP